LFIITYFHHLVWVVDAERGVPVVVIVNVMEAKDSRVWVPLGHLGGPPGTSPESVKHLGEVRQALQEEKQEEAGWRTGWRKIRVLGPNKKVPLREEGRKRVNLSRFWITRDQTPSCTCNINQNQCLLCTLAWGQKKGA
jgi:hypothetical protein